MKIQDNNYYFGALEGLRDYNQSAVELYEKNALFRHEGYIELFSQKFTANVTLPILTKGYATLGLLASKSLGLVSKPLGKRVQLAWHDPMSTETVLKIVRKTQVISEPLARRTPVNFPLIHALDKCFISSARLIDIVSKDVETILSIPIRAKKLYSKSAYEGFLSERTSTIGKVYACALTILYGIVYIPLRLAKVALEAILFVSSQIKGRKIAHTWAQKNIACIQTKIDNNFFLNRVTKKETDSRKRIVRNSAYNFSRRMLHLVTKSTIRGLIGRVIVLGLTATYDIYGRNNEVKELLHWTAEKATFVTLSGLNLILTATSLRAYFTKIHDRFIPEYNPKKHGLFYNNNLIGGVLKYKTLREIYKSIYY